MKLLQAFRHAARGILMFFRFERNGAIQLIIAVVVLMAGVFLKISLIDWIHVVMCVGAVFAAEMLNTAVEKLCDMVHPGEDDRVKDIKDLAAGAVLVTAIASAAIGGMIFIPYL
jgi:diacylglycerol kinase